MSLFDMSKKICLFNFRHVLFPPRTEPMTAPKKEQFVEGTYFIRNIRKYRFKKKSVFPEFSIWIMLLTFLQKNLVNVDMRIEKAFYNISLARLKILISGRPVNEGTGDGGVDTTNRRNHACFPVKSRIFPSYKLQRGPQKEYLRAMYLRTKIH